MRGASKAITPADRRRIFGNSFAENLSDPKGTPENRRFYGELSMRNKYGKKGHFILLYFIFVSKAPFERSWRP